MDDHNYYLTQRSARSDIRLKGKKFMNKITRLLALLAALMLIVAACGSGASDEDASDDGEAASPDVDEAEEAEEPAEETTTTQVKTGGDAESDTTLQIWTFGATGLEPLMDEWAAENGVSIEIKTSDFAAHHEGLLTALVASEVPDIAVIEVGFSSLFKTSPDQFIDLRDYGAGDLESNYVDWRWEHGVSSDGSVIGLPTDVGGLALAYRWDKFEAAGLPTDRDEVAGLWTSWEDFLDVGEKYVADTGEPFIDDIGVLYSTLGAQGGERYFGDDGSLIYDSSDKVKADFDLAAEAGVRGISANLAGFSGEWNAAMAEGGYAVQLAPSWMMGYIQSNAPDTSGLWDITTLPESGGNWGGSQLAIPAAAPNPELAYDLISTILSPENQLKVFIENGNFPSTVDSYSDDALLSFENPFFNDAPVGQIYADAVLNLDPVFEGVEERAIAEAFGNALDRVEVGELSPEEGFQAALDEIQLELDR